MIQCTTNTWIKSNILKDYCCMKLHSTCRIQQSLVKNVFGFWVFLRCQSKRFVWRRKKPKILEHFWQRRSRVIPNSCKWPRNFKAWVPWATNNKILVRTLLYISRFLRMSFCKGYSSCFNTSPGQFSLLEFLYMISLASKSLIVYVLDDCQIWNAVWQNNTSIVCYLNLLKESFPYNSG